MIAELTNHLWQSTVFAVVVGLLTLAYRKNRAHVRYWLWLSASVMARRIGQGLTPARKLMLGGAAALAIAIPLALGMTVFASQAGTQGTEASNGRLPSFETASIKPDKLQTPLVAGRLLPGMPLAGVNLRGGNFTASTIVAAIIMDAYGNWPGFLSTEQVLGGPAWIWTDFYQIKAKVSDSIVDGKWKKLSEDKRADQTNLMLRSLLINRFKLRVEHETKVLPIFEVVLAKNGPKITEDKTVNRACRMTGPPGLDPGELGLDVKSCHLSDFLGAIALLPGGSGRRFVDKTGLHGRYSFTLHWTPRPPGQNDRSTTAANPSGSPFLTALREQVGLDIVSAKAPMDVVVIKHIERPSGNWGRITDLRERACYRLAVLELAHHPRAAEH